MKCVLYDMVRRDQIIYFKRRLRQSHVFSEVMINKEEHKDLRVKSAMLRHAALMARRDGKYVYQRPNMIVIDNTTYTLDTADCLPQQYKRNPTYHSTWTTMTERELGQHTSLMWDRLSKD